MFYDTIFYLFMLCEMNYVSLSYYYLSLSQKIIRLCSARYLRRGTSWFQARLQYNRSYICPVNYNRIIPISP